MEDSIFTKIIKGEIPSHKVYEDEKTYAFLDIHPEAAGHTLVVPKVQVDKIYDLPDEDYVALWAAAKKIAKHMEEVLGERMIFHVIGVDVPHAHIHIVPVSSMKEPLKGESESDHAALAEMARKLEM